MSDQPAQDNDADAAMDKPVWGAKGIAPVIKRGERQTFHLLESGLLDASKVGKQWVSTPRPLLRSVGAA
ncbi:MAG: hypothetical protein WA884_05365 [Methyloceanibacter sp.]